MPLLQTLEIEEVITERFLIQETRAQIGTSVSHWQPRALDERQFCTYSVNASCRAHE